jgi:hypothetical protein
VDEVEWIKESIALLREDIDLSIDPDDDTLDDRVNEYIDRKKSDGEMVFLNRIGSMAII